jgi:CheY-like chemotaxis protein
MVTDESKVSQILRNFISNALKFTERGSVVVGARLDESGRNLVFSVRDTGIGVAPVDVEMIFQEFTQVPSMLQQAVKGTGLGLPLCRKLAALLGGEVGVDSTPGQGSTFWARIPLRAPLPGADESTPAVNELEPGQWVLIIEDDDATRHTYEKFLQDSGYRAVSTATLAAAASFLRASRPAAVILDILLPGEEEQTWRWLADTKSLDPSLPVLVASVTADERKARSLGADAGSRSRSSASRCWRRWRG